MKKQPISSASILVKRDGGDSFVFVDAHGLIKKLVGNFLYWTQDEKTLLVMDLNQEADSVQIQVMDTDGLKPRANLDNSKASEFLRSDGKYQLIEHGDNIALVDASDTKKTLLIYSRKNAVFRPTTKEGGVNQAELLENLSTVDLDFNTN